MAANKWKNIDWKSVHIKVYDLQYQIFCSAKKGNINLVRYYQRILVKYKHAKLLAVRSVTQDNRGKATAGIDEVSKLTSKQRVQSSSYQKFKVFVEETKLFLCSM